MRKRRGWLTECRFCRSWLQLLAVYLVVSQRFFSWRLRLWLRSLSHKNEGLSSAMKQTLLIVRHGQTAWNVEHRLPGQLEGVALNETGKQQAERLAESLTVLPLSAIISSPLERARDTAAYLARGRNLEIQLEPDLMDTNVGPWAGQVIDDLTKNDPAWTAYVKDPSTAPEGIETFPQVQQRVVAAIKRWRTQKEIGDYPVFVAHADVVKVLLAHYTGLDIVRAGSLMIENASVSIVEFDKENTPHVLSIGWTPRPGWLKPPIPEEKKPADSVESESEQKI